MGVVQEVHPGADGVIRTATIKTASSTLKRPVTKLCTLPRADYKPILPYGLRGNMVTRTTI
ncbi:hypothetical protein YQE_09617, partial [Dendroctonus ponderosae]